jgi:hypothetical protein
VTAAVGPGAEDVMVKPYWQSSDGRLTVVHGDCRDYLPSIDTRNVLVLTDPPYGINLDTKNRQRQRTALTLANDYSPVYGDAEPYDPTPLFRFPRLILFGGNHFADRLPPSSAWLIWDKTDGLRSARGIGFNDNADAELIWTNLGGPVRMLKHQWIGLVNDPRLKSGACTQELRHLIHMARDTTPHTSGAEIPLHPPGFSPGRRLTPLTRGPGRSPGRRANGRESYVVRAVQTSPSACSRDKSPGYSPEREDGQTNLRPNVAACHPEKRCVRPYGPSLTSVAEHG